MSCEELLRLPLMTGVVDKKSVAVLLDKNLGVLPTLFASVTTHRR